MLTVMDVSEVGVAVRTGGVRAATLKADGDVFLIEIEIRDGARVTLVAVADRKPRTFRDPAAALRVLLELGIAAGHFDTAAWRKGRGRTAELKRPDRSQALKAAHSAAAADREFRRQVEQLIAGSIDGNASARQASDSLQSDLAALLDNLASANKSANC